MPNTISAECEYIKGRFAIIVSRFNQSITSKLLDGAVATLNSRGVPDDQIDVVWVPGAWEIPVTANQMARGKQYTALITLGAVIRGETTHDQLINQQISRGLGQVSIETGVPIALGVLTCNSLEQAIHRSGGKVGNKGIECAEAALEMANLLTQLPE